MARPVQLTKSNYYVLLMQWAVLLTGGDELIYGDLPRLNKTLIDTLYLPARDLAKVIGKYESEYFKKLPLMKILHENNDKLLKEYLYQGSNKRNDNRYIRFLELIVETALQVSGKNPQYKTSDFRNFILSPDEYKFALNRYHTISTRVTKELKPPQGIDLALDSDQQTKNRIRLLANFYGEYLNAGRGNKKNVCEKIESRPEFRKAGLAANIREEYVRYDNYFDRLAKKINETYKADAEATLFNFTGELKADLIIRCSNIAQKSFT